MNVSLRKHASRQIESVAPIGEVEAAADDPLWYKRRHHLSASRQIILRL